MTASWLCRGSGVPRNPWPVHPCRTLTYDSLLFISFYLVRGTSVAMCSCSYSTKVTHQGFRPEPLEPLEPLERAAS